MKTFLFLSLFLVAGLIFSCTKPTDNPSKTTRASFMISSVGHTIYFTSTSENDPTDFTWDFGDGSATATGKTTNHTYASSGTYSVSLTASGPNGTNTFKNDIVVREQIVKIHTSFGDMYMWLYDETPAYKANFFKNVFSSLYENTTFHRVVPNFVIQGGDSLSKGADQSQAGTGGPDNLPLDVGHGLTHVYGAVGAASHGAKGPGNNWQFYIVTNTAGDHNLDGNYTVFGIIMKGMDVANTIQNQPADGNGKPATPIRMNVSVLEKSKPEILAEYGYTVK